MLDFLKQWGPFTPSLLYLWLVLAFGYAYANLFRTSPKDRVYYLTYGVFYLVFSFLGPLGIASSLLNYNPTPLYWFSYLVYFLAPAIFILSILLGRRKLSRYNRGFDVLFFRKPNNEFTAQGVSNLRQQRLADWALAGLPFLVVLFLVFFSLSFQTCWWLDTATGYSGCIRQIGEDRTAIEAVQFSPDGKMVAIGGSKALLKVVNVEDGNLIYDLKGHQNWISSIAFSPDGKLLASSSWDKTVRFWSMSDGSLIKTLSVPMDDGNATMSMVFSPDGKLLATASYKTSVKLWDVTTGTLVRELASPGVSVAFSLDGSLIAAEGHENSVLVWQVKDGVLINTLKGHTAQIKNLAFSPDGRQLISVANDLRAWDVSSGKLLRKLDYSRNGIRQTAISPDAKLLATTTSQWNESSLIKNMFLQSAVDGRELESWVDIKGFVYSMAFSSDSKVLVTGSDWELVRLWRVNS
jgi:hypothetical protein